MELVKKQGVRLDPNRGLPRIHLSIASLIECRYRLVLRTVGPPPRGEVFVLEGDLGDDPEKFPDHHLVNFVEQPLQNIRDFNGATLSALLSYASPSDSAESNVSLTVSVSQDGQTVENGVGTFIGKFTSLGTALFQFGLVAA